MIMFEDDLINTIEVKEDEEEEEEEVPDNLTFGEKTLGLLVEGMNKFQKQMLELDVLDIFLDMDVEIINMKFSFQFLFLSNLNMIV